MGRGPRPAEGPAELRLALRWLRLRRQLSQREVVEAVEAVGERLSLSYLKQVELGHRRPSEAVLAALLRALGSDRAELDAVAAEAPWRQLGPGRARAGRRPPPEAYARAAEWALSEPFSSPVAAGRAGAAPPPSPQERLDAELAELARLYAAAPRDAQLAILRLARAGGPGGRTGGLR